MTPKQRGPRSFSSNVLATAVSYAALPIAAFAASPVLAQNLGVEGRGAVSAAVAPLMLATAIATVGLPEAVNYFVARSPNFARAVVRRSALLLFLSGVLATVLGVLISPVLAGGDQQLADLIALAMLATVPTLIIGAIRGAAQGVQAWGRVNLERYITAFTRLGALLLLAATGNLTVLWAVIVLVASPLIGGLSYIGLRHGRATPRRAMSTPAILRYGSAVWVGSLSGIFLVRLDQALMTPIAGLYELGLYAVAVNVAEVVPILNQAVRDVIFSSDARDRNDERLGQASRVSTLFCAIIGLGISLSLPLWLPALFGDSFIAAIPACFVLIASTVIGVPGSIAGAALSSRGRPGLRSTSLAVGVGMNIALLLPLAPALGALGAAVATLGANLLTVGLNLYFCQRFLQVSPRLFLGVRRRDFTMIHERAIALIQRGRK